MNAVLDLITLEENETILGIFPEPYPEKIKIKDLDLKYHNIEDLPRSFFHIGKRYISYNFTHIFTNKRYIGLGLNFEQINEPIFIEIAKKIKIQNYILCIPREELVSFKIDIGIINNIISLRDLVVFDCATKSDYLEIKAFLIEKWDYSASEFEEKENINLSKLQKLYLISNIMEYTLLIYPLIKFYSWLLSDSPDSSFNLSWVIILSICAFMTIIHSITIGFIQIKKKKTLISIYLRVYIFLSFALLFPPTFLSLFLLLM